MHDQTGSVQWEIVMLFNEFKRLAAWLFHSQASSVHTDGVVESSDSSVFAFDPMWHGDHWQNLLSSPMDARHYVMEDWSVPGSFESGQADPLAQGS
jgi:hypothetical protein